MNLSQKSVILKIIFAISIAVILFIASVSFKHIRALNKSNENVTHTYQVLLKIEKVFAKIKNLEIDRRNFLLTREQEMSVKVEQDKIEIKQNIKELKILVNDNKNNQVLIKKLEGLVDKKMNIANEVLDPNFNLDDRSNLRNNIYRGKLVMDEISLVIDDMRKGENNLLASRSIINKEVNQFTPLINLLTFFVTILLLIIAIVKINKDLKTLSLANEKLVLSNESSHLAEQIGNFGTWQLNLENNEYTFSENEYRLLGHEPYSFKDNYQDFMNQYHPEDRFHVEKMLAEMIDKKNIEPFTVRIIRKDGALRFLRFTGKIIKNLKGEDILLGITSDVTEEIEKNKLLQKSYEELKYYNESSKEAEIIGKYGFWKWNVDHDDFEFSDNIFRMFGIDKDKFNPKIDNFIPTVYPDDLEIVLENLAKLKNKDKNAKSYEHRIIKQDTGEIKYLRVINKPIENETEGFYYLMITQDITDEINKRAETLQKNRELEISNKELQAFNYVASHDLQEPLRKIETFISRLETKDYENLSENGKQYFDRIKIAAGRMRLLIKDLLQFSRTNKSEKVFEKSNLNELLENAKHEIAESIEEKGALIIADQLPVINVIPFQVQQLFINLLGNSVKYSKPNVKPEIKINYEKSSFDQIGNTKLATKRIFHKFSFTDNGIGFSPEYSERIFELFSRLHNKDEIAGTGIGLAICKKIVDNHKGYIFAEGKPNKGATFTVYLPEVL